MTAGGDNMTRLSTLHCDGTASLAVAHWVKRDLAGQFDHVVDERLPPELLALLRDIA